MKPRSSTKPASLLATREQLAAEAHRIYLLEQLGIEPLVSYYDAPGAAATTRVVAPHPVENNSASGPSSSLDRLQPANIDPSQHRLPSDSSNIASLRAGLSQTSASVSRLVRGAVGDQRTHQADSESVQTDKEPAVSFQLLIATTGNWLWVERLATGLIRKDQLRLIQSMGRVLDRAKVDIRHVQFDWPLVDHPQLPRDLNAARQSVAGQLQRRAREMSATGIVILGESTSELISEAMQLTRILVPSTIDMLQMPALKREAWLVMRPHVVAD